MKRLVVDTSNLLFRVASAQAKYGDSSASPEDQAGLSLHMALNSLKHHYRKIKPDQLALAFEGGQNWRKTYTRSDSCVSKRLYKGNRVHDSTKEAFYTLISSFEEMVRAHTSLVCLSAPTLEGDAVIGGYTQRFAKEGDDVVILSGDKDFTQLLKFPNVTLINPDDGKPRGIDKKTGQVIDPIYFMFEKCIRGDSGDNVLSAYPRVRSTMISKAFIDEFARANMMNHEWEFVEPSTGDKRMLRVGDLFDENKLLMDLEAQPSEIRQLIDETIDREIRQHGTFSLFYFQKFCAKHGLKKINDDAAHFVELFSASGLNSPHREEAKTRRLGTFVMGH